MLPLGIQACVMVMGALLFGQKVTPTPLRERQPVFIENRGQWPPEVLYMCRLSGHTAWITRKGLLIDFQRIEPLSRISDTSMPSSLCKGHRIYMRLIGASPHPQVEPKTQKPHYYNFFIGNNPDRWVSFVRAYEEVWLREVYPGIHLRYYTEGKQLRYDFVVDPGADLSQVRFTLNGTERTQLTEKGLHLQTVFGEVYVCELRTFQEGKALPTTFVRQNDTYTIQVAHYNPQKSLWIDPLIYSTFLGAENYDAATAIAVTPTGEAIITGWTMSQQFDTTPGAYQTTNAGYDVFITKLSPDGSSLIFSTYLGGTDIDQADDLTIDGTGAIYVAGRTSSLNWPVLNAPQPTYGGGPADAFITKLSPTGNTLLHSTYVGGSDADRAYGIAVDGNSAVYATGFTSSSDFPTTTGALQATYGGGAYDAFVVKMNSGGSTWSYATYLGGNRTDIGRALQVDATGTVYVGGETDSPNFPVTPGCFQNIPGGLNSVDVFIAKITPTSGGLVYATYLGGNTDDYIRDLQINSAGEVYVAGNTEGNFPTTSGVVQNTYRGGGADGFITKLNTSGSGLVFSTYLGGNNIDVVFGIGLGPNGDIYVAGQTNSTNYPTTPGAYQRLYAGSKDGFLTKLNPSASAILYSTYIGGSNSDEAYDIAVDATGAALLAGETYSLNYPVTPNAYQTTFTPATTYHTEAFVSKLCPIGVALTSAPSTANQTACIGSPITSIQYQIYGTPSFSLTGLPPGVSYTVSGNRITISGTPTTTGSFSYVLTVDSACGSVSVSGTIEVISAPTITLISPSGTDNQTLCANEQLIPISYSFPINSTVVVSNLPQGVGYGSSSSSVTILGTPSNPGSYTYTVTVYTPCGNVSTSGTISVNTPAYASWISGSETQSLCIGSAMFPIQYSLSGHTSLNVVGLPVGVSYTLSGNTLTLSGTPQAAGVFPYQVLANGCQTPIASGSLEVDTIDLRVNVSPSGLTSLQANAVYQWLDCSAGYTAIPNANAPSFTPTSAGLYAVIVGHGACYDTSACVFWGTTSLEAPLAEWRIFPNPTREWVQIQTDKPTQLEVLDITGRLLLRWEVPAGHSLRPIPLPVGWYWVRESSSGQVRPLAIQP